MQKKYTYILKGTHKNKSTRGKYCT